MIIADNNRLIKYSSQVGHNFSLLTRYVKLINNIKAYLNILNIRVLKKPCATRICSLDGHLTATKTRGVETLETTGTFTNMAGKSKAGKMENNRDCFVHTLSRHGLSPFCSPRRTVSEPAILQFFIHSFISVKFCSISTWNLMQTVIYLHIYTCNNIIIIIF